MIERGKREIPSTSAAIEKDLVYPAVSGGDIVPFGIKSNFYVLVSQDPKLSRTSILIQMTWMTTNVPLTYAYLKSSLKRYTSIKGIKRCSGTGPRERNSMQCMGSVNIHLPNIVLFGNAWPRKWLRWFFQATHSLWFENSHFYRYDLFFRFGG